MTEDWEYSMFHRGFLEPHPDKEQFEKWKALYEEKKKKQYAELRAKICPHLGKPCIGCDCLSFEESWISYDEYDITPLVMWLLNREKMVGYKGRYELAQCKKGVF